MPRKMGEDMTRAQNTIGAPKRKNMFLMNGMDDNRSDIVPRYSAKVPDDTIFYLYGEILEPIEYTEMVHSIRYAEVGQQILIHINSVGGCLSTCLSIVNAIRSSAAIITTIVDGEACSAAAMIWLAGHTRVIASSHCFFMLHEAGWAMHGKTSEHETQTKIMKKVVNGLVEEMAQGLLTEEEKADFNKGLDIYLHGSEIIDRVGQIQDLLPEEPEED